MSALACVELQLDLPRPAGTALNLNFAAGQSWGILGPNGVGKTTLLHTLAGLKAAHSGQTLLQQQPLKQLSRKQIAQQLGLVFQERQDSFPATVLETVLMGRHPWLAPWQQEQALDLQLAQQALAALDCQALAPRLLSSLSGGERQRVAIATLMTQNPAIWLLDEPTNHLDLQHQMQVMRLLTAQAHSGKTVIMCLHDLNLAARWCSHVLLLYPDGRARWGESQQLLQVDTLTELYQQPLTSTLVEGHHVFIPLA